MSATVALRGLTFGYARGGGHFWVYLNWALGLRALGCRVLWLEGVDPSLSSEQIRVGLEAVRRTLEPWGLQDSVVACSLNDAELPGAALGSSLGEAAIDDTDLLLDLGYNTPERVLRRARRSAFVDIDPGLTQIWWSEGQMPVWPHDLYFSIGETVGTAEAHIPDCGVEWHYTPPAVFLPEWPVTAVAESAPFTTISHWWSSEWVDYAGEIYDNSKRFAFLRVLDLPRHTSAELELALSLDGDDPERERLERHGWRVREGWEVAATPHDYREYVRRSRGEFACAKPSYVRQRSAWVSDRTICYLATGRPVVIEDTASPTLPRDEGMLRFSDTKQAAAALQNVLENYDRHALAARRLAEERFDAERALSRLLERALP